VSRRRITTISTSLALAVAIGPSAALAGGSTSHAKLWGNSEQTVGCGIALPLPHTKANTLLCSARGIPRPKHSGDVGDPFVQLKASGRPQLVLISQDSYETTRSSTLKDGTTWSGLGVTCTAGKTVTCKNGAGHGFTIGRKYKSF
jgi:hypothetical protein